MLEWATIKPDNRDDWEHQGGKLEQHPAKWWSSTSWPQHRQKLIINLLFICNKCQLPIILFFGHVFSCPDFRLRQLYTYPCHSLTESQGFYFLTLKSNPRDLWPLRHLIRVMRRHDLTKKIEFFFEHFSNKLKKRFKKSLKRNFNFCFWKNLVFFWSGHV